MTTAIDLPTSDQLAARLDETTAMLRLMRDRAVLLTMRLIVTRAREVSSTAEFVGLSADSTGEYRVTSVLTENYGVVTHDGNEFDDIPNLDDAGADVWKPFTLGTAFDRNDLGERFLKVSEVLALDT